MDESVRLKAREYLLRARIYRFCAAAFAVVGGIVFMVLYFRNMGGGGWRDMLKLSTALMILVPFLPAFILSLLSTKAENKFLEIMEDRHAAASTPAVPNKKK